MLLKSKILTLLLSMSLTLILLTNSVFAYNSTNATTYADYYATNPNPNYALFGSDCTNFVSQALHNGGIPFVGLNNNIPQAWWYNTQNTSSTSDDTWSYTWSVAKNNYSYIILDSSPHLGYVASTYKAPSNPYPSGVSPGDIFYYDWSSDGVIEHAGIYTANGTDPNSGSSGALQDQHTTNRYHAIWTLYPYNQNFYTTTIYAVHINR